MTIYWDLVFSVAGTVAALVVSLAGLFYIYDRLRAARYDREYGREKL